MAGSNEKRLGQGRNLVESEEEKSKAMITIEEVKLAWKMLKKKKAAGIDGIPNEVWIYGGRGLNDMLVDLIGRFG